MPVTILELENFKSYAGIQRIGPFRSFTSIIGPNGSGKSNVMDALSFVLGLQSKDLRSTHLKDLIFRPPKLSKAQQDKLTASAAIIYELDEADQKRLKQSRKKQKRRQSKRAKRAEGVKAGDVGGDKEAGDDTRTEQEAYSDSDDDSDSDSDDESVESDDDEEGEEDVTTIKFQRTISAKGVAQYLVNGSKMTQAQYVQELASIGVLVKARNFLVFQGDVETLARKSPTEFVDLLENVSGSRALKDNYDEALQAKEQADAARLFCIKKQSGLKGERRLLKEQKEEADRFQRLQQQRQQIQTDLYLWMLYHMEAERKDRESRLETLVEDLNTHQEAEQEHTIALNEAKTQAQTARQTTLVADKRRAALAEAVEQLEPSVIEAAEHVKTLQKKLEQDRNLLRKREDQKRVHGAKVQELETEIADSRQTLQLLEDNYEKAKREATPNQPTLTRQQEEEYDQVKEAAAAASVELRRTVATKAKQLEQERGRAGDVSSEIDRRKKQKETLEREIRNLQERIQKLASSMTTTSAEREQAAQQLAEAEQQSQTANQQKSQLEAQIEEIDVKLREVREDRRKNRDEKKMLQAIHSLRRHFPGVLGRLVDLCRPTQRRLNLAVTVAAGKDMDSIVVDTKQTAIECIRYLREQRVGTATFLPLDTIQTPSPESTERIRSRLPQGGRFSLAVDVITCDDSIKKAVSYAVGNTVICDTLDAARELCFGRASGGGRPTEQARVKAVTWGGAVISRAGTMTGGVTSEDSHRAGRFDDQVLSQLRSQRQELDQQRANLDRDTTAGGSGRQAVGRSMRLQELQNRYNHLKNKVEFIKSDSEFTRQQLAEKQQLLRSTTQQLTQSEQRLVDAEQMVTNLNAELTQAVDDVKTAEDRHLAPFRQATGLRDLQAYERAIGQRRDEFNKNRRNMTEHIMQLEQRREYEVNRDMEKPINRLIDRISTNEANLTQATANDEDLKKQFQKAEEDVSKAEADVGAAVAHEKDFDEKVQECQKVYDDAKAERTRVSKAVAAEEHTLERLRGKLHETLQKAHVEEVELPMKGRDQGGSRRTRSGRQIARSQDGDDDNNDDDDDDGDHPEESQTQQSSSTDVETPGESLGATQFSQPDNPKVVRDQREAERVDFSSLHRDLTQKLTAAEETKIRKDFDDQRVKIDAEIESIAPNMKAHEAFTTITQRLKDSGTDFDKAKADAHKATAAFQRVKARRAKRFLTAFNHIDKALKDIYRDMTKSDKHLAGGTAYLSLDDMEEPYLAGMKFNAMPPTKRFRDIEQLSGGEKTVAALALLFALHSFHPAPFFVMDEVDAALDKDNLRMVCNYIQQRSESDFQCIVISLKDIFYEASESLVGICRDVGSGSSRTMTLDLTKYPKKVERGGEASGSRPKRRAASEGGEQLAKRLRQSRNEEEEAERRRSQPSSPKSVATQ